MAPKHHKDKSRETGRFPGGMAADLPKFQPIQRVADGAGRETGHHDTAAPLGTPGPVALPVVPDGSVADDPRLGQGDAGNLLGDRID